ncbi:MAG: hypothetical protein GY860_23520 [Desulfobacteraceae bacterium]|nr:hypothetical protein [Desulfobacteraceae bacterium]
MVPFFLVCNRLLLNQFPDINVDREFGRKHPPITVGKKTSVTIYGSFLILAFLSIIAGWLLNLLPLQGLINLICIIPAVHIFLGVKKI